LQAELADSSNFGMAKSLLSQGKDAGFDMTTQEGLNQFMLSYNASRSAADNRRSDPEPDLEFEPRVETIRRSEQRVGRNDPCHCGSGKKYKKCCLKS